jgi:hypothetical protein
VVLDATKDIRFKNNPLVTGSPNIRFYAGAPLTVDFIPNPEEKDELFAVNIGTICLIDNKPHESFDEDQRAKLQSFANLIVTLMNSWKRDKAIYMENNLQMSIIRGLQSSILSRSLQSSINSFVGAIFVCIHIRIVYISIFFDGVLLGENLTNHCLDCDSEREYWHQRRGASHPVLHPWYGR